MLKELINIGVGKGAEVLNTMLSTHIELDVPSIEVIEPSKLAEHIKTDENSSYSAVQMKYQGNFSGDIELIFPLDAASELVNALTGEMADIEDMDELRTGTLQEIGNVVLNAVIGTISNVLSFELSYSLPNYLEGDVQRIVSGISDLEEKILICARTTFTLKKLSIRGNLIIFFSVSTFEGLIRHLEESNDTIFS